MNEIAHFDVAGPDIGSLRLFYEALFGWQVESMGPGYSQVHTPGLDGALVETPEASLTVGVVVQDLDRALELASERGGSVVMPKTDNGFVVKGQVADPAGNRVTLIQA